MSNLVLLAGDGALARVLTDMLDSSVWNVCGYIGQNKGELFNKPVYSFKTTPTHLPIILAVLNPIYREEYVQYFGIDRFPSVSDGFFSSWSSMKQGTVVMKGSYVMNETKLENFVHVHTTSIVGHNCIIKDYSIIGAGCIVCGYSEIGEKVRLGVGAKILPHVKIGNCATIGAGAVVREDVPEGVVVGGVPATVISKTDFNRFQRNN